MSPTGLGVGGPLGVLQGLVGLAILLLPGALAAQRMMPASRARWLLAPVVSLSVLPVAALLLGVLADVPITPATTLGLALAVSALVGWPVLRDGLRARLRA